ncbi:molybdopterin dinucleotide binding domain-containing protein, partial [Oleiphilus sp. HI0125]
RDVRSNNSWMHNTPRLVKGKNRCTAQINTADAKRLKLKHGELVKVSSDYGAVTIPCEVTDDIMTGVMSIPHGWGHDHEGTRLSVASQKPGVNLNVLISDQFVDKLTGTSALNGMPVRVEAIASTATKKRRKTTTKKTTKAVS